MNIYLVKIKTLLNGTVSDGTVIALAHSVEEAFDVSFNDHLGYEDILCQSANDITDIMVQAVRDVVTPDFETIHRKIVEELNYSEEHNDILADDIIDIVLEG